MEYKIDATNRILGRLATEVAMLLRGKNTPAFDPARFSGHRVTITHTDKLRVTGKKMEQKMYRHHSGYHGGLKEVKLKDKLAKDSRWVFREAVSGMLPKNRLRARMLKNLLLIKGEK